MPARPCDNHTVAVRNAGSETAGFANGGFPKSPAPSPAPLTHVRTKRIMHGLSAYFDVPQSGCLQATRLITGRLSDEIRNCCFRRNCPIRRRTPRLHFLQGLRRITELRQA